MKLLLTGGAGYVGSACLRWLLKHGHDAYAFDNMDEGNAGSVPDAEQRLITGDILNKAALVKAMRDLRIDAVMHFAALAIVPDSLREPDRYWTNNLVGTKTVLEAMREVGVQKIVFSSTCATYGFDVPMPITEESRQNPHTPYGTTKLSSEFIIKDYSRAFGFGYVLLRYFNACGADPDGEYGEDREHETHLIPLILLTAMNKREKVMIYGTEWDTRDGTCVRDYIHTDDLASAHQLAVEAVKPGDGRVYNIGTGNGTTVLEVLKACEAAVGRPIKHELAPARPGDPPVLVASSDKLRRELGWKPRFDNIRDVVASAWKWHSKYPDGYAGKR